MLPNKQMSRLKIALDKARRSAAYSRQQLRAALKAAEAKDRQLVELKNALDTCGTIDERGTSASHTTQTYAHARQASVTHEKMGHIHGRNEQCNALFYYVLE